MQRLWRSVRSIHASSFMPQIPRQPLIVVLGATGTGKSQLAVELAKRHNGEIINGDAMQLYAGLPILTNKISVEEQQGIPHHLLGCIGIEEPTWVVSTFVKKALGIIDEIRARGRLPILVGGTHYYTQSLLFHEALVEENNDEIDTAEPPEKTWPILAESTGLLLQRLKEIDPVMAARWHPNDRRKIQRSLMIFLQTGRRASEIYAEQKSSQQVATLRLDPLLFWVHTEQETLRQRLDKRVGSMVAAGLSDEVSQLMNFEEAEASEGRELDKTRGVWVAIGFKEWEWYCKQAKQAPDDERREVYKHEAIERINIANRQYAKKQIRWIRIKLADSLQEAGVKDDLYLLDSTDVEAFDGDVVEPASRITGQFLSGEERPLPGALSAVAASHLTSERAASSNHMVQHCTTCDISCATEQQWNEHLKSRKHRALAKTKS